MKRNVKIAKALISMAREILGDNRFEQIPKELLVYVDDKSVRRIEELVEFLDRMLDTYMLHVQNRGQFLKGIGGLYGSYKDSFTMDLVEDPMSINWNMLMGAHGDGGNESHKVQQALVSVNKALSQRAAEDMAAVGRPVSIASSLYSRMGIAIMNRINRAMQYQSHGSKQDYEFLLKVSDVLKRYRAFLGMRNSKGTNNDDVSDVIEDKEFMMTQKGVNDHKIRLENAYKELVQAVPSMAADVKKANEQMEMARKNVFVAIGIFNGMGEMMDRTKAQIFAVSSVTNVLQNAMLLVNQKDLGLDDPGAYAVPNFEKHSAEGDIVRKANDVEKLEKAVAVLNGEGAVRSAGAFEDVIGWLNSKWQSVVQGFKNFCKSVQEFVGFGKKAVDALDTVENDEKEVEQSLSDVAELFRSKIDIDELDRLISEVE